MLFPTASNIPRPIRLKESTRAWAWESLHGKYGDEAVKNGHLTADDIDGFDSLSDIQKYDACIRRIAESAPLRICDEEKICGAATLGDAIKHIIPVFYNDKNVFDSVSHLTMRYDKVINEGLDSYKDDISHRLSDDDLSPEQCEFLQSLDKVIESMRVWHGRYLEATKNDRPDLHALLEQVPFKPAHSFHEALQSLWFTFAFVRLCGNWPGIGRIDRLLGDFLRNDLKNGTITIDQARELMASFFIKGCEWIQSDTPPSSGDAQHYQNIVLAGIDPDGNEVTNEVTYLVLDVVEELSISDYPITVRLNSHTPQELKTKVAEVMRHGGGVVAVYNEDLILKSLKNLGYPDDEARDFANDGCWEIQIPGKTNFSYMPFDALQIFNEAAGITGDNVPKYCSIDEVYNAFQSKLREKIEELYRERVTERFICENNVWKAANKVQITSVVSLFEDDCIANARSYHDFGTRYVVRSPHIGGAPDVSNSLYAIEKLVFEEKKTTYRDFIKILQNNWEDNESLRLYVKNNYTYYGNDSDEADAWHTRVLDDFADMVDEFNSNSDNPVKFIPGVSTFGRQIEWLPNRCATAFGYRKGDILSGNDSPSPGTDSSGATAIIKSYCKSDLEKQSCGAALDIKIFPSALNGDNGVTSLCALMDGFLTLGGSFMQLDTVDVQTLREAQKDPQKYKTLSVRVSGWNARFVTLNEEWQNMIIERTSQGV